MDYIRDRTLYLLTLATPHEGSYLPEAVPAKELIEALGEELATNVAESPLARVFSAMNVLATLVGINIPDIAALAIEASESLAALFDTPALEDLQFDRMAAFNQGPLSPDKMRHSGSSPIVGAEKSLIPVYACGSSRLSSPRR